MIAERSTTVRAGAETAAGLPIDPVCRMAVDPDHSAGALVYDGVEFHFCSLECANSFSGDPVRYASAGGVGDGET